MENLFYSFEDLVKKATTYLMKIQYSPRSLDRFRKDWSLLAKYMDEKKIEEYTPEIGIQFLHYSSGHIEYRHLSEDQKNQIHHINILSDFATTGVIIRGKKSQKPISLDGEIGHAMIEYIQILKNEKGLAPLTTQSYYRSLSIFLDYLKRNEIITIIRIDKNIIVGFCKSLNNYSHFAKVEIVLRIRGFADFLFENGYIPERVSESIIKPRVIKRPKLPSFYSPAEVASILDSINRATPEGKRDYCIVLLAARLGIRTSDICALKFTNLLWERSTVAFTQVKTGNIVELPLTAEIGNAIINYLKNGRPETTAKEIFIRHTYPYEGLSKNHLYTICSSHIKKAGIIYDGRRHGLHSLRHSLATNLLESEVPLPIISGILGHSGSSSTKAYLRVDLTSLRKCALDLPEKGKEVSL